MADWLMAVQGDVPVTLPKPMESGFAPGFEPVGGMHSSIGGAETFDEVGKRYVNSLKWRNLPDADYYTIRQFWDGTQGIGPFEFSDPTDGITRIVNVTAFTGNPTRLGLWAPSMDVRETLGGPMIDRGTSTATTDASGRVVITHRLGSVPSQIQLTSRSSASYGHTMAAPTALRTATQFTVQVYYASAAAGSDQRQTPAAAASNSGFPFDWVAYS